MKRLGLIIIAVALILEACQITEDATAPNRKTHVGNPAPDWLDIPTDNCTFEAAKCDVIRAGIDYLIHHANESCRMAGQAALQRFEAPASSNAGYRDQPQPPAGSGPDIDMGVWMDGGPTPSGWEPTSGYVEVSPSFWNSQSTSTADRVGALLAHEEQHQNGQDGPDHAKGVAMGYQISCLNPAP